MEIFKLFGTVLVNSDEAEKSIHKTEGKASKLAGTLGKGIKTAAKWGAGLAAGAGAVGAAMMGVANKSADAADKVDKMSQKIGLSKQGFQEWNYAMGQSGVDIGVMQNGMKTMTKLMDDANNGVEKATGVWDTLGLSVTNADGSLKSQEDMMKETIMTLANMEDSTERARLSTELFGRAGTELEPLLNSGADGIQALMDRSHELGLVMSDDAVTAGVKFGDTLADVKDSLGMVGTQIGMEVMPIIQKLLDWVIEHMPEIKETVGKVLDGIKAGIAALTAFWEEHGDAITAKVKSVMDLVGKIIDGAMKVIGGLIEVAMDLMEGNWSDAWDGLVEIVTGIGSKLFDAGKAIFEKLWDGLKEVWEDLKSWFQEKVDWIADKLFFWRKSKDEMSGGKSDGSHASGLPFVPYDGYKAVLHRGETVLSARDTEGLVEGIVNGVAAAVSGGTGGSQTVVIPISLDGREIARAIYDPLNDEIKQRGVAFG